MMTEQEKKLWTKAYEQGHKDGRFERRHEEFVKPLLRYILMGIMMALGIVFGIGAIAFMIVCFMDLVIGLIGMLGCGIACGTAFAVWCYFIQEY